MSDPVTPILELDTEQEKKTELEQAKMNMNIPPVQFKPPSLEQVEAYCREQALTHVDPAFFLAYYEPRGWMMGACKMRDWKSALVMWEKNGKNGFGMQKARANRQKDELIGVPASEEASLLRTPDLLVGDSQVTLRDTSGSA